MKKLLLWILTFSALFFLPLSAEERPSVNMLTFELKAEGEPTLHIKEEPNGISINEYKGKVVLLNFFGKHCKWCMKEIPHLVDIQKEFKEKFQVIAIHAQQPMTPGERHMLDKKLHFNYPIYEYSDNPDFVQYIAHRATWEGGLPFSIIFDQNGSAAKIIPGYAPKEDLEKIIEVLTKQP
ncbi:TlpA disulfide reductase family protein [Hydrogenimonas sp.]|uniref:TlpA family protein disulfide reductase n=1 Tax=Hydrogenimonas sp. TaxID=2231112 RepID=UPI002612831A|nr:TlpA disulfide reductase family protein [Hydrogenimonas sp.]